MCFIKSADHHLPELLLPPHCRRSQQEDAENRDRHEQIFRNTSLCLARNSRQLEKAEN